MNHNETPSRSGKESFFAQYSRHCWSAGAVVMVAILAGLFQNCSSADTSATINDPGGGTGGSYGSSTQALFAGYGHTCRLSNGGSLSCWGKNENGELGSGATFDSSSPVAVVGVGGVSQVAVGGGHICALASGTVSCWGSNLDGQLGNNSLVSSTAPVSVVDNNAAALSGVISIASGASHSCAIMSDTSVVCWGNGGAGEIGSNTAGNSPMAVSVVDSTGTPITGATQLALGSQHSCALLSGGAVSCWGLNSDGELGNGSTANSRFAVSAISKGATSVVAGASYTCALVSGVVQCWGDNTYGEIAQADNIQFSSTPLPVSALTDTRSLAAGANHVCAVATAGTAQCWGFNSSGQLGDGSTINSYAPVTVMNVTGITALTLGTAHSCAQLTGDSVKCWGADTYGQLGDSNVFSSAAPVAVQGLTAGQAISQIAGGNNTHFCLISAGHVACWGDNSYGELGNGSVAPSGGAVYANISAVAVADGAQHSCAILNTGGVSCWGSNIQGQLGVAPSSNVAFNFSNVPVAVAGVTGATAVATGSSHSCAIIPYGTQATAAGGQVVCWGENNDGQLGNNTTVNSSTPVTVTGITTAKAIAAGNSHTCALLANGSIECWGYGALGDLGNGAMTTSHVPVAVSGISTATALAAGANTSCAITSAGGAVQCWGYNADGELGNNMQTNSATPVSVSSLTGATSLSIGANHACAVINDGSLQCWGADFYGQLGDSGTSSSLVPVTAAGISGATAVAAGNDSTCAVTGAGAAAVVQCWGWDGVSQLGDHPTVADVNPTAIQF